MLFLSFIFSQETPSNSPIFSQDPSQLRYGRRKSSGHDHTTKSHWASEWAIIVSVPSTGTWAISNGYISVCVYADWKPVIN